jgi:CMP-N,N'-diacetyllegionaminic acid synthase
MNCFAIVTARGGSKGIPGKNIKRMAGKPMIAWTIEAALRTRQLDCVIVSTDDEEIASISREWGAEVPFMRPAELATDTASSLSVLNHYMQWAEQDGGLPTYLLVLQPTSPLRVAADIEGSLAIAHERQAKAVIGVCEVQPHTGHPWFAKQLRPDATMEDFMPRHAGYVRRQDLPPAYAINGAIYLYRTEELRRSQDCFPPEALAYVMPPERSLDVDTPWDFHLAELILKERHGLL